MFTNGQKEFSKWNEKTSEVWHIVTNIVLSVECGRNGRPYLTDFRKDMITGY